MLTKGLSLLLSESGRFSDMVSIYATKGEVILEQNRKQASICSVPLAAGSLTISGIVFPFCKEMHDKKSRAEAKTQKMHMEGTALYVYNIIANASLSLSLQKMFQFVTTNVNNKLGSCEAYRMIILL
ncbi:hypothetical protein NPIL_306391 [Nephila pilipes]|uniref:Uncharacterized protein n=1 Tax=Nephila pilipes TaxID=299642 RepID=A0A8X6UVY4_NEPPI|nr:hypothetical protein NPIL_306391 [Nephila pilipes]